VDEMNSFPVGERRVYDVFACKYRKGSDRLLPSGDPIEVKHDIAIRGVFDGAARPARNAKRIKELQRIEPGRAMRKPAMNPSPKIH